MSPESSDAILLLENLTVKLGNEEVLSRFSLEVGPGERIALLGKNGSGKTTLLRVVAGLKKLESGRRMINGRIGMVFQNPDTVLFGTTVRENLFFPLRSLSISMEESRRRIELFVTEFGFSNIVDRDILTLSGGQRQLVSLAAALISEPSLLLLDEPLSMLDRHDRDMILRTLEKVIPQRTSMLFATNRFSEVLNCERFIILGRKEKLFDGGYGELRNSFTVFEESGMSIPFEIAVSC